MKAKVTITGYYDPDLSEYPTPENSVNADKQWYELGHFGIYDVLEWIDFPPEVKFELVDE